MNGESTDFFPQEHGDQLPVFVVGSGIFIQGKSAPAHLRNRTGQTVRGYGQMPMRAAAGVLFNLNFRRRKIRGAGPGR